VAVVGVEEAVAVAQGKGFKLLSCKNN